MNYSQQPPPKSPYPPSTNTTPITCQSNTYLFDTSTVTNSLPIQFNLVCDENKIRLLILTQIIAGLAALIAANLAFLGDRFGRVLTGNFLYPIEFLVSIWISVTNYYEVVMVCVVVRAVTYSLRYYVFRGVY